MCDDGWTDVPTRGSLAEVPVRKLKGSQLERRNFVCKTFFDALSEVFPSRNANPNSQKSSTSVSPGWQASLLMSARAPNSLLMRPTLTPISHI